MRAFLAVGILAVYFCAAAWPGLKSGLGNDDLMNMTFAFRDGWWNVLKGNLLFFTTQYRPLGSLFYLVFYELFGPVSLPMRIAGIGLVGLNLALVYHLARTITGRAEAGLLAALFLTWHGNLAPLFYTSGNIYDVLAFLFYFAAMGYYAASRRTFGRLSGPRLAVLAVLQICALNSKEFTATLPLILLAGELLFHRRAMDLRAVGLSVILSGAYTLGKIVGADSLVRQEAYAPRLSVSAYADACGVFLNDVFYRTDIGTPAMVALYVLLVAGAPVLLRNRMLGFAAAVSLLGALPVMLIPPRGIASSYVALGGLALWLAILVVDLRDRFALLIRTDTGERKYLQAAVFVVCALLCVKVHGPEIAVQTEVFAKETVLIAQAQRSMNAHREWFAPGKKILVVSDPFTDRWAPIFLGILYARDMEFVIHRYVDMNPKPDEKGKRDYSVHLVWENDGFVNRPL